MRDRQKSGRRYFVLFLLGVLFCMMLTGKTGIAAEDSTQESGSLNLFDIGAQLLSSNDRTYDIQITVSNQKGEDWEGTVCVKVTDSYSDGDCSYDTVLSLPQGSTKQFVVRIPKESVEDLNGTVQVSLLDKKFEKTAEKIFKRLLLEEIDMVSVGILSDTYQSLTYLDLGGESTYYGGNERPVRLLELDTANLINTLDSLHFLVIDNYNTGILTEEMAECIEQWANAGGMLIVGTGKRAEDTLSGLDFLNLQCARVFKPGEGFYSTDYAVDLSQLYRAELTDAGGRYRMEEGSLIQIASWGDGAVEVVPYALSELGQTAENYEIVVWELLQNANGYVRVQKNYGSQQYNEYYYILHRIFRMFGNGSSRLNFGVLKWIVVLYVIFVGPVLYLILRALKKRDWYWFAVPAAALVGIFLVYCAGSGFEVVNTRVFSVTVENLSDQTADAITYMHCYDAGHKAWELQMADRYRYAGSLFDSYYGSYEKYHVRREGERIALEVKPSESFEDCHFIAGTDQRMASGSITGNLQAVGADELAGTVTNGTDWDFIYFAILFQDTLYVCRDLPAGGTYNLDKASYERYQGYDNGAEAYLQGYMYDVFYNRVDNEKGKRDIDVIAALGMGISAVDFAEEPGATVIIGVTQDWDRAMDDNCTETAYGCVYSVQ